MRRKLFANCGHYRGRVTLGAVTGPGTAALPWDRSRCSHAPDVKCSGKLGCVVDRAHAKAWNKTAPGRWREMHRVATQRVRRRHGAGALVLIARVWEFQSRGVLHVHPVLGLATPGNRRAAKAYLELLSELAPMYGFGHCQRKLESKPGQSVAAYLSAYFVGGRGRKLDIRETVKHPDVPAHVVYVSRHLTQATGVTMRFLRRKRYLFVLLERGVIRLYPGEEIDVMTGELRGDTRSRDLVAELGLNLQ